MTGRTPLAITAVVAVHNEEAFVRPCLASLAALADEILVAHDGPCRDRSVEIAREFTRTCGYMSGVAPRKRT
jgi:glycosyltransferase involved in cell wall biosynthesis